MRSTREILSLTLFFLLAPSSCSKEESFQLIEKDALYVLDEVSNAIHAFDLKTGGFTAYFQYDDLEKYRSKDFALTSNGEMYVLVEKVSGLDNIGTNTLKVFDAKTLKETRNIDLDLYPADFALGPDNTLYMSHGLEYTDQSGWAISIYKEGEGKPQEFLTVKGAPQPPTVLTDGDAYFPYFGGGLNNYGESNVLVYDNSNKTSYLLFEDGFTYMPPRDLYLKENSLYILFNGIENESPPYYTKPKDNDFLGADKSLLIFNEQDQTFEKIPLNIKGSDMEVIVEDNIAYIYYCDSVGAKTSGLYLVNLETREMIADYDLGGGTFSEEMLLIDKELYITNRAKKGLDIFDIKTGSFRFIELPKGGTPYNLSYSEG